ncbi:MAG: lactate utilization protein C [Candidatus Glassbacteria bacterium]
MGVAVEKKGKILDRIRLAKAPRPRKEFSGDSGFLPDLVKENQELIILRENLRKTDTGLIMAKNTDELGRALLRCFEDAGARRAIVFSDEIPKGHDLVKWWSRSRARKDSCEVQFGTESITSVGEDLGRYLAGVDVCVTGCLYLVADGGVCVMDSSAGSGRLSSLLPPHHIVVAEKSRLVSHLGKVMGQLSGEEFKKRSSLILISGPSRTADIEKELVLGVHGPLTLTVILTSG